jgi:hypothetical protein
LVQPTERVYSMAPQETTRQTNRTPRPMGKFYRRLVRV